MVERWSGGVMAQEKPTTPPFPNSLFTYLKRDQLVSVSASPAAASAAAVKNMTM